MNERLCESIAEFSDMLANKLTDILQQFFQCMYSAIFSHSKPFFTQTNLTQLCLLIIIIY